MFDVIFWVGIAVALWFSWVLFRDLADVHQLIIPIPRERAIATWYQRHAVAFYAFAALAMALVFHLVFSAGSAGALWTLGIPHR